MTRCSGRLVLGCVALAVASASPVAPLSAQEMSPVTLDVEALRAVLLHGLEQHHRMDVEFTRAIPDSALRWKPTPEVRDFAQQIEHIVLDNANFVVWGGIREERPDFGDSEAYLNDKAALERVVDASYDWVISTLRTLPPREMLVPTEMFGETVARWRVYLQILAHADWTRGQMVPYFRIHGRGPPEWRSY